MTEASVWHPITTAPRDGTSILYFSKAYSYVGVGRYKDGHIWTGGVVEQPSAISREWEDVATHWMPLPANPGSPSDTPSPQAHVASPADQIIGQIEELFPNWRAYRDLVDCITCELHELRQRAEAGR